MTGFLLDTNVVGETMKPRPSARLLGWLERQAPSDLFLASVTLGELVRGARKLKDSGRRRVCEHWIRRDLARQFESRVLPFDRDAAVVWGEIMGEGDRIGRPRPAADARIAAVARVRGLTLATRNTRDFEAMGVTLLDPWTA